MANRATSANLDRRAARRQLVADLGDWAAGPGPVYRQLARAIAAALARGAPAPGDRLPSERALAGDLALSRGTVVAAYDALVAEGLAERRPGSGTFAVATGVAALPPGREGTALVQHLVDESAGAAGGRAVIDLSLSVLHDLDALAVGRRGLHLSADDLRRVSPETGYSPWGLVGLRRAIADHVTRRWGLSVGPDEVVVTTGAQQAISVAAACWVRPGDTVVVEDPTYAGAVAAFAQAGARLRGVPVDADGVRPGPLEDALTDRPALVYLQPTLHSPTGAVLSERRRSEVARLLARRQVPLVEDMALADLAWSPTPPPIAGRGDATVAVVGSLSKLFWGGLRVGFVCAPTPVALRLARIKATHDLGSPAVGQLLAEQLLRQPGIDDVLAGRRRQLRHRHGVLASALAEQLPSWHGDPPAGGLSMWVRLPRPEGEAFARLALAEGVGVATAGPLSPSGGDPHRIRLSFSPPPDELRAAVARLARAWRALGHPA